MSAAFDVVDTVSRLAPVWYPELGNGPIAVDVLTSQERNDSHVDMIEVSGNGERRQVFAKQYRQASASHATSARPRLGLAEDDVLKPEMEFAGLVDLARALQDPPPGVAAVRPLEHLAEHRAIFIERFPGRDARHILRRSDRRARDVASSAGSALALAHRALDRPGQDRMASIEDVDRKFDALCDYVDGRLSNRTLVRRVDEWWRSNTPDRAPVIGVCHGDCAPRNLLVDDHDNVAWIDGLFRSRAPVCQDIAYFVASIRVRARLVPFGRLHRRARHEDVCEAFIGGYRRFGEVDPEWLARLEILVLLDRLSSVTTTAQSQRTRVVRRVVEAELGSAVAAH